MANFTTIIPNETIQEYLAGTRSTITAAIGTPSGCSLTLTNKSPIEYTISQNGQIIETVEPYTMVTLNTTQNMQVTADAASSVAHALTLPSYRVSYTTSGLLVSATAKTSIQFPGALPVVGNMTVNNFPATIQVTTAAGDTVVVAGEVAITVPSGTLIGIDGVATVEFNGTQEVSATIISSATEPVNISGPVSATIDTSGGPVDISGSVSFAAGQSVGVTGVSGDVSITPSATSGLPITTGSGGLTVGINNTVDIQAASGVDIPVSGSVDANITNATLDSNITNVVIGGNPGFMWNDDATWALDFTAPGDNANVNIWNANNQVVMVDKIYFSLFSPGGHAPNYSLSVNGFWFMGTPDTLFYGGVNGSLLPGNYGDAAVFEVDFSTLARSGLPINGLSVTITSTIAVSETIVYSIFARYASTEVVNTSDNPANVAQPAVAYNPVINQFIGAGGVSQQVLGSNANRKFFQIWNLSTQNTLWVQYGQAARLYGGYPLGPGTNTITTLPQPSNSIWVYGETTGSKFAFLEG